MSLNLARIEEASRIPESATIVVYVDVATDFILSLLGEGGTASTGRMDTPGRKGMVLSGLPPGTRIVGASLEDVPSRKAYKEGDVIAITHQPEIISEP